MGLIPDLTGDQEITGVFRAAPVGWSEFVITKCETKAATTGAMGTFLEARVVAGPDEGAQAKDTFMHATPFARSRLKGLLVILGLPTNGLDDAALKDKRVGARCVHEAFTSIRTGEQLMSAKIDEYRAPRDPATASPSQAGAVAATKPSQPAAPQPVGKTSALPF